MISNIKYNLCITDTGFKRIIFLIVPKFTSLLVCRDKIHISAQLNL